MLKLDNLTNLLGDAPEFLDGVPRLSQTFEKGFFALECESVIKGNCMIAGIHVLNIKNGLIFKYQPLVFNGKCKKLHFLQVVDSQLNQNLLVVVKTPTMSTLKSRSRMTRTGPGSSWESGQQLLLRIS